MILRLQATSPKFFNILKVVSLFIAALAFGLQYLLPEATLATMVIPLFAWTLKMILGFIVAGFTFVFGTSALTAKDVEKDVIGKL